MGLYNKILSFTTKSYLPQPTEYNSLFFRLSNGRLLRIYKHGYTVSYSDDNGETWSEEQTIKNYGIGTQCVDVQEPINGVVIISIYHSSQSSDWGCTVSYDYGETFNKISNANITTITHPNLEYAMPILKIGNEYICYKSSNISWKTTDFITFTTFSVKQLSTNKFFTNVIYENNRIVLSTYNYNNFISNDLGETFEEISNTTNIDYIPIKDFGYYSISSSIISIYTNSLNADFTLDYSIGNKSVRDIKYSNNYLFVYTDTLSTHFLDVYTKNGILFNNYNLTEYGSQISHYYLGNIHNKIDYIYIVNNKAIIPISEKIVSFSYPYISISTTTPFNPSQILQYDNIDFYLLSDAYIAYSKYIDITPQDRITIYPNDYSTVTGSQVLENAIRSINHKVNSITIKDGEVGSVTKQLTISANPNQKSYTNTHITGTDSSKKQRQEVYVQQFSNIILTTNLPIIQDTITSDNFSFSNSSKKWYKTDSSNSAFCQDLFSKLNNDATPCPMTTQVLEQTYNVEPTNEEGKIEVPQYYQSYSVSNIQKLNNYQVKFDCQIVTKWATYETTYTDLTEFIQSASAEIIESNSCSITLTCKTVKNNSSDFVFSIDLDGNNNPIQNNPLQRADNELFSLYDTFFNGQANAIIQDNKDGRMVLTVNSTSNLGLYIGKELTVTLKDGTLANNGATFEVVGIKEKFTGINWKQTYTLKEKKISV